MTVLASRPFLGCLVVILFGCSVAWAEYQPKGKRDPFIPLLTKEGQRIHPPGLDEETASGLASVVLQGVVFDPKAESYAIINGRIVRQHEEIDGMKVLKIEPTTVTLLVNGEPYQLTLRKSEEEEEEKQKP